MSGRGVVWWGEPRLTQDPTTEAVDAVNRGVRRALPLIEWRAAVEARRATRAAVREAAREAERGQ